LLELGNKHQIVGVEHWPTLVIHGRPKKMPRISKGHEIVGGVDQGENERMFLCRSLQAMQKLYDAYAASGAFGISWYTAPMAAATA
jgi:hypothetical protein